MLTKKRIVRFIIGIVLGAICLHTGMSGIAAFMIAERQPYLMSDTIRSDFLGYDMLAAIYGAVCIVSGSVLLVYLSGLKKRSAGTGKNSAEYQAFRK